MARIVLLNDYLEGLKAIAGVLRQAGHTVNATDSEPEALRAISAGEADLLVQDLLRPRLGGARFLRVIRSNPALADFPVMIHSAIPPRGKLFALKDPVSDEDLPIQGWLGMPARVDELIEAVAAALVRGVAMHTFRAEGLTLEPQVGAHAEEMFAVLSDPAIYEYENEPPASVEWLRERFLRLETRRSADAGELWLNWVLRLPSSELIGFVQATIFPDGRADIAYVLASRYWGRGLGRLAVRTLIYALVNQFCVHSLAATLKRANHRSRRLLERLEFTEATPELCVERRIAGDELLMVRDAWLDPAPK